jgi:ribosomal protein S18 acetylase RimI-like enzyme
MEPPAPRPPHLIRPYTPADRPAVRAICADTGFLGQPIDAVFEDRELFADYLTSYYTDAEPEATFVCELDGEVKGYAMGSRFPRRKAAYEARHLPLLVARGLWRYVTWPYNAASRRYVRWIVTEARRENPHTPPDMAHFHFNVRPEARSVAATADMVDRVLRHFADCGEKQVYGQIVVRDGRRGERLLQRFGFRVVDRREITKYRALHPGKVELCTIVKDLTQNASIYGNA